MRYTSSLHKAVRPDKAPATGTGRVTGGRGPPDPAADGRNSLNLAVRGQQLLELLHEASAAASEEVVMDLTALDSGVD